MTWNTISDMKTSLPIADSTYKHKVYKDTITNWHKYPVVNHSTLQSTISTMKRVIITIQCYTQDTHKKEN